MEHNAHIRTVYAHKSHPLTHVGTHTRTHIFIPTLYSPSSYLLSSTAPPPHVQPVRALDHHHLQFSSTFHSSPPPPAMHTYIIQHKHVQYVHTYVYMYRYIHVYVDTSYIHDIFTRMPFPILRHTSTTGDSYTVHTLCTVKWVVNSLAEQK